MALPTLPPEFDASAIAKLIPQKIRDEVVLVGATIIALLTTLTSFIALKGNAAHLDALVLDVVTYAVAFVQRGSVTPSHLVAVDKRDTSSPVVSGTSGPVVVASEADLPPGL